MYVHFTIQFFFYFEQIMNVSESANQLLNKLKSTAKRMIQHWISR